MHYLVVSLGEAWHAPGSGRRGDLVLASRQNELSSGIRPPGGEPFATGAILEKSVTARRRDQHARGMRYPEGKG